MGSQSQASADSRAEARARLQAAERILCDVDGCLISGSVALPGAARFLQSFGDKLALISNNSTDTAETLAARLRDMGLEMAPAGIYLAGELAIETIRRRFGQARVFALANAHITAAARAAGLLPTAEDPEVVLICRDTDLTFDKLETALIWISRGLPVVLANGDLTHPGTRGPAMETGGLFAALTACVEPAEVVTIGKPDATLFHRALDGVPPDRAIVVGDNPDTDIRGAADLGLTSILLGASPRAVAANLDILFS